jgi:hypothetical protein
MKYRPQPSIARFLLPFYTLLCLLGLVWIWTTTLARASEREADPGVFLLSLEFFLVMLLAGVLLYLCWCAWTIGYTLEKDRLVVACGGVQRIVPLASITAVHAPGDAVRGRSVVVRWRGVPPLVPGYVVGGGKSAQLGNVLSVATVPPHRQLFVQTPGLTLGLSPANPSAFISRLEEARRAADDLDLSGETGIRIALTGPSAWGAPLWSDRLARVLLLAGLILNILFFGYISLTYGDLPVRLPLHWNAQAQIDRIGTPAELLRLPLFATGIWLVNVVLAWWAAHRERAVSLFLLAGAVAAQVVFWAGTLSNVLRTTKLCSQTKSAPPGGALFVLRFLWPGCAG